MAIVIELIWIFFEILFIDRFFYSLGYVFVKIITFGKYPKKYHSRGEKEKGEGRLILLGGIVFISLFTALVYLNGSDVFHLSRS